MANEIQVRSSLQVRATANDLVYASQPTAFQATQHGAGGPVPGMLVVGTGGVDVPFTGLSWPSMMRIMNLDLTNFVTYGINDKSISRFLPLGELLPGETYALRLSRFLRSIYPETGTGSLAPNSVFHIRASQAPCNVLVEAFQW
jgi:hypothetical protein